MPGRQPTPGETPLEDLSGLRVQGVTTKAALDALEAENVRRATLKYLASKPTRLQARFDVEWMLALHAEMFGRVWKWAGTVRTAETNIGARPRDIQVELHELQRDLMAWEESGMALEEQAVWLHHRAVQIHPFPNGNGRWARMLANIWLAVHDAEPIEWPDATIGTASAVRDEYLAAVRAADRGEYAGLEALHSRFRRSAPR